MSGSEDDGPRAARGLGPPLPSAPDSAAPGSAARGDDSPLGRFVSSLVQAWRKLLLYPEDHPARRNAIAPPYQALRTLIALGDGFELGVDEEQLVIGEASFGAPATAELARTLYQRNVAIVFFQPGLGADELAQFLLLLAPQKRGITALESEASGSLQEELAAAGVEHVRVEDVDYQKALDEEVIEDASFETLLDRPTSLWSRILRAFLGQEPVDRDDVGEAQDPGLDEVLALLGQRIPQSVVGDSASPLQADLLSAVELLASSILDHLGIGAEEGDGGLRLPPEPGAREQAAALFRALPSAVRDVSLEAALDALFERQREADLFRLEALVDPHDLLVACRRRRDRGLGAGSEMLALIERLEASRLAGSGQNELAGLDPELGRETSGRLLELLEEDTDRLPATLVDLPIYEIPEGRARPSESSRADLASLQPAEALRLMTGSIVEILEVPPAPAEDTPAAPADSLFEVAAPLLSRLELAARELVVEHDPEAVIGLLFHLRELRDRCPQPALAAKVEDALSALWARPMVDAYLDCLQHALRDDHEPLRELAEILGPPFADGLVEALGETEDRSLRRLLLSFLESLGPLLVGPAAMRRLRDPRWYVVRNMVSLLGAVEEQRATGAVRDLLGHDDDRVKLEALRFLGRLDPLLKASAVRPLLLEEAGSLRERAIDLCGRYRVRAAVEPLISLATTFDPLGRQRSLRLQAVDALGRIGDPAALAALDSYFSPGVSRHNAEERRAAYRSLAGYPAAARAELVARGRGFRDDEIRSLCEELASLDASPSSGSGERSGD